MYADEPTIYFNLEDFDQTVIECAENQVNDFPSKTKEIQRDSSIY